MFIDEIKIYAKAGKGGDGTIAWKKMKFQAKGGPSGGNGGNGGNVFFKAVRNISKLSDYRAKKKFSAEDGQSGFKDEKEGKNGEDIFIEVPVGSVIYQEDGSSFSLLEEEQNIQVLKGGRGGFGNAHFKSSTNTTPYERTLGKEAEEAYFEIKLELLVDLGLVGLPSAGKSSLLNTITNARSKVGNYPFTTLEPHLGDFWGFIIADIPGLIEGASEGKGLGHKFLKHIKRTKGIAHLVSLENQDPLLEYEKIEKELENFSPALKEKRKFIILTKSDLVSEKQALEVKQNFSKKYKNDIIIFSIISHEEIKELEKYLISFFKK